MKKLIAIFFIAVATTFVVTSCVSKTPLSDAQKVYAGKWVANDGTWIQIYNDGSGDCKLSSTTVTGGSTTFTDSSMTIGVMGIGSTFIINEPPYEDNGQWVMKLDGIEYSKE